MIDGRASPNSGASAAAAPELGRLRQLPLLLQPIFILLAVGLAGFQIWTAYAGPFPPLIQRSIHLGFGLSIGFLLIRPFAGERGDSSAIRILDISIGAATLAACFYLAWSFESLILRFGAAQAIDLVTGSLVVLAVLELGRRTIGPTIPLLAAAAWLYAWFGPFMPGILVHRGYTWTQLVEFMYLSTDGMFGLPIGVSAEIIFVYLFFGSLLNATGAGGFFLALALRLTGRSSGGPAKGALVSSAMFGSISGSVVANVLATGSITIPMMRRIGFSRQFAGAVEATASTGGQIMPPIMGAAAFIMAEFLQVPYSQVIVYATIPAILFFASIYAAVHFRSRRLGLKPESGENAEPIARLLLSGWTSIGAVAALVWFLMGQGLSAEKSALYAAATLVLLDVLRSGPSTAFGRLFGAAINTAKVIPPVIAAVALSGIIVGGLISSGLSEKLSLVILSVSGGSLPLTLLLSMTVALLLGTGMTTAADYIITSLLAVPALVQLGVLPEAAHMFILYFACMSAVTPPVALGAIIAGGVAGAPPFRTALVACKLALAGLIVPYMFVYSPALLMNGEWVDVLHSATTALIGVVALAMALEGWCWRATRWFERLGFFSSAILLMMPELLSDLMGLGILVACSLSNRLTERSQGKGHEHAAD